MNPKTKTVSSPHSRSHSFCNYYFNFHVKLIRLQCHIFIFVSWHIFHKWQNKIHATGDNLDFIQIPYITKSILCNLVMQRLCKELSNFSNLLSKFWLNSSLEFSGCHDGTFKDGCLLGCSAVWSCKTSTTFQRCLLPPSTRQSPNPENNHLHFIFFSLLCSLFLVVWS
jgi:hypothetical protein